MFALRYRSPQGVSAAAFADLLDALGEVAGQTPEQGDPGEYLFTIEVDAVPCVGAVVIDAERPAPYRGCHFVVLTNAGRLPQDLDRLDPLHGMIERCFCG